MKYNIDGSASEIYEALKSIRNNFLRRAEKSSLLTIPMLVPQNSEQRIGSIVDFPTPRQGVGARGVNHLSSRLLLTLLPPSAPFFKYVIDPFALDVLAQADESIQAQVKATLSQIEQSVQQVVETEAIRVPSAEIFKHLIVAGNVCQGFPKAGGMTFYTLSQYTVLRDAEGDKVLDFVLKECLDRASLPQDVQELWDATQPQKDPLEKSDTPRPNPMGGSEEYVELYTRMCLQDDGMYRVQQEFCDGTIISDTIGTYKEDDMPFRPLRWTKVQGEAYGRGLIEEYLGDLVALEGLSQALIEGALGAARLVGLVRPNSNTHPKDLNDAKNGEFVSGIEDDVHFLQVEKGGDFKTAAETGARIEKRLEAAFLLNSAAVRDAERVTAEEVRYVAQELETTLGGVYTILAHEFQLPLVRSILARLTKQKKIPAFPKNLQNSIKPVIVTGIDALGRNAEIERFRAAFQIIQGLGIPPEVMAQTLKLSPLITYIFSQVGVTIKGIVKTEQEMMQEQEAARKQQMIQDGLKAGIGPGISAAAKLQSEGKQNQAAAPQGQPPGGQ